MADKTDMTMAETARSFFMKLSLAQRLRHKFSKVIRSDAPGAIRSPKVLVS